AEMWRGWGVEPFAVLGHSVGEYAAACVAGLVGFEDALAMIAERGRIMDRLESGGAMSAIMAPVEEVRAAIERQPVCIAAINGPAHTVISGEKDAVDAVMARFASRGVRVQALAVSHAFHSHRMDPIAAGFGQFAARKGFRPGRALMVSTVTGEAVSAADLGHAEYWRRQVRDPVMFHGAVRTLVSRGCRIFIEIGPSTTLLGMARQCAPEQAAWLPTLRRGRGDW